jgi:hypothetical protein
MVFGKDEFGTWNAGTAIIGSSWTMWTRPQSLKIRHQASVTSIATQPHSVRGLGDDTMRRKRKTIVLMPAAVATAHNTVTGQEPDRGSMKAYSSNLHQPTKNFGLSYAAIIQSVGRNLLGMRGFDGLCSLTVRARKRERRGDCTITGTAALESGLPKHRHRPLVRRLYLSTAPLSPGKLGKVNQWHGCQRSISKEHVLA